MYLEVGCLDYSVIAREYVTEVGGAKVVANI